MENQDHKPGVQYVDAEPIEGTGAPAPVDLPQQPHVYTYYHKTDSCIPCCGPFGCSIALIGTMLLLGNPKLLNGALYAVAILVVFSVLAQLFARRR